MMRLIEFQQKNEYDITFYFLNKDYSFTVQGIDTKSCIHGVLMKGSLSQTFHLGISSYFMIKNG